MQEKEMFEPCTKHGQEKKYDCLECRLTVDSTPLFKKEEPQKECDHIVGYLVSSSFYCEGSVEIEQIRLSSIDKGRNIDCDYCPECGEKVNWAVIERSLNLKKDE